MGSPLRPARGMMINAEISVYYTDPGAGTRQQGEVDGGVSGMRSLACLLREFVDLTREMRPFAVFLVHGRRCESFLVSLTDKKILILPSLNDFVLPYSKKDARLRDSSPILRRLSRPDGMTS